jgi:HEAT repeat protein
MDGRRTGLAPRVLFGLALLSGIAAAQDTAGTDWLRELKYGDSPNIRIRALQHVKRFWYGDGLADPDPGVRRFAARTIFEHANFMPAGLLMEAFAIWSRDEAGIRAPEVSPYHILYDGTIPGLIALAETGRPSYRDLAIRALRVLVGSPAGLRHVDALVHGDPAAREAAVSSLLAYSERFSDRFRGAEAAMRHPDRWVRESVLEHLRVGPWCDCPGRCDCVMCRRQVRALEVALRDPSPRIRGQAIKGLRRFTEYPNRVIPSLLDALHDDDPRVRCAALESLRWVEPAPPAYAGEVERLLTDPDADVRAAAFAALGSLSHDHGIPERTRSLLRAKLRAPDAGSRFRAAAHLRDGRSDLPMVVSSLVDLLHEADYRLSAVNLLGDIGATAARNPAVVPRLLALLKAPQPAALRHEVVLALQHIAPSRPEVVSAFVKALESDSGLVRVRVGWTLGATPDRLPLVVSLMHHFSAHVREGALHALTAIGAKARSATRLIVSATHDPDSDVRHAAVRAVESVCDRVVAVPVLRRMFDDQCPEVRGAAVRAVSDLSRERIPVAEYVRVLGPKVRYVPLRSRMNEASESDRRADVRELREVLKDRREPVRWWAVEQLGAIGRHSERAVATLGLALSDPSPVLRRLAAEVLSNLGARAWPAVPALSNALKDEDAAVADAAAEALGAIGPPAGAAVPGLIDAVLSDQRRSIEVESALVGLGEAALAAIASRLEHGDLQVRTCLTRFLPRLGPIAVDALLIALKDPHPMVRVAAASGFQQLGARAGNASGAVAGLLADDYVAVRVAAIPAMAGAPSSVGVPALRSALGDPSGFVRHEAAAALADYGREAAAAVPALTRLVRSDHDFIRYRALRALAAIGPPAENTLPTLREMLPAAKQPVRLAIREAVAAIEPR